MFKHRYCTALAILATALVSGTAGAQSSGYYQIVDDGFLKREASARLVTGAPAASYTAVFYAPYAPYIATAQFTSVHRFIATNKRNVPQTLYTTRHGDLGYSTTSVLSVLSERDDPGPIELTAAAGQVNGQDVSDLSYTLNATRGFTAGQYSAFARGFFLGLYVSDSRAFFVN